MLESMKFTFNNIDSEDMGVTLVSSGSGLFKESFLPNRTLVETTTPYSNVRTLKRVDKAPLSYPFTIYIEKWRDWNHLRMIANWLDQDEYCEFWTELDPERIFHIIVEGASELSHNGCKDGFITLTVRTLYPYATSPTYIENGTVESNSPLTLHLNNFGDATIRPYITLRKIGDGDISIHNVTNGQKLEIAKLYNNEVIELDCENELIRSSLEDSHNRWLYDNHNGVWLDFDNEVDSEFVFTGDFEFEFKYNLVYKNETR